MARYWLAPVSNREPFTIGAERFVCAPDQQLELFLQALGSATPRLLLPFKAQLLLADEEEGVCGADVAAFSLSAPGDIRFDGERLRLSDCAVAWLARLPGSLAEAGERLDAVEALLAGCANSSADSSTVTGADGALALSQDNGPEGRDGEGGDSNSNALSWLAAIRSWLGNGWIVTMLKEET